ncbi:MAG: CpsD/CapB family tyrosine-protein kinase [bacterium]
MPKYRFPQYYYEETPEVTEFKRIVNKLQIHREKQEKRLFMVTSANISEGKSTTAAYLAATIARTTHTATLLIDCDLRRPTVHKQFLLDKEPGTANILQKGGDIRKVLKNSSIPNLKIMTSGIAETSPAELFSSRIATEMFKKIRFYFKSIVIDSPPVLPVSDTLLLSNIAEGIFFVTKAGISQKRAGKRALELLQENRDKILGAIINNAQRALPYYYDYASYNYQYYEKAY